MMTEDFTKLPIGVLVSDSRTIVRCSVCRRRGALDVKLRRCVHVEGSAIGADGLVRPGLGDPGADLRSRSQLTPPPAAGRFAGPVIPQTPGIARCNGRSTKTSRNAVASDSDASTRKNVECLHSVQ